MTLVAFAVVLAVALPYWSAIGESLYHPWSGPLSRMAYKSFISYSHQDDRPNRLDGSSQNVRWAEWLYQGLMEFRTPEGLVGLPDKHGNPVPDRTWPIFRDTNELPIESNLSEAIVSALKESELLVVLCSPRAVKSRYVDQEIRTFKARGGGSRVLAVILAGEPNASDKGLPDRECFPESLKYEVLQTGELDRTRPAEPIAADVRDPETGDELSLDAFAAQQDRLAIELKRVAAGILGVSFGKLVDWEAISRKSAAERLLEKSAEEVRTAEHLPASRQPAQVLEHLFDAEKHLVSASTLIPSDDRVADQLLEVRRTIFEFALSINDLGLASSYLGHIEPKSETQGQPSSMWSRLTAAWELTDPGRAIGLKTASDLSVAITPSAVVIYLICHFMRFFEGGLAVLAGFACAVAMFGAILTYSLGQLRLGNEPHLKWTSVVSYLTAFSSLASVNPIAFACAAYTLTQCSKLDTQRIVWKKH